jgi:hypothetical protein
MCHMKLSKVVVGIALAMTNAGFISTALANHFTVNGSENGSFTLSGIVTFGAYNNASISTTTFFPDNQSDTDNPVDNGTPVTLGIVNNGSLNQYSCTVTMGGSVVGGVASITSVSKSGSTFCSGLVIANLPWRLHTLSAGSYSALLEGVGFSHTGVFSCLGTTVGLGIQPGYVGFDGPLRQGGCFLQTNMALTATPSLEIVSN